MTDPEVYSTLGAVLERLDGIHNRLERIDRRFEGVVTEKFKLDQSGPSLAQAAKRIDSYFFPLDTWRYEFRDGTLFVDRR